MAVTSRPVRLPTSADLRRAGCAVTASLRPTPLVEIALPSTDATVLAKLETMQPTGSFKVRGAVAALAAYAEAGRPVVAASAGNHGLGVAFAAARLDVPATIVVPAGASRAKIDALLGLGADLVIHGEGGELFDGMCDNLPLWYGSCIEVRCENQARSNPHGTTETDRAEANASPAHEQRTTPASCVGSSAKELVEDLRKNLAGGQTASRRLHSRVEPTFGSDAEVVGTERHVLANGYDQAEEITDAVGYLATACGLVVEGAGAVGLAALLTGKVPVEGAVVALLTGRNIAADRIAAILDR